MLIMGYDIIIGDYKLPFLASCKINKDISNLSDTAEIHLPLQVHNQYINWDKKIKVGAKVEIRLGYTNVDKVLPVEFVGYVSELRDDNNDYLIRCEDELFKFKHVLKDNNYSEVDLETLLKDVISQVNGEVTYTLDCKYQYTYSKFTIYQASSIDVLKIIQNDTKANIYIKDNCLIVAPPYNVNEPKTCVTFDFYKNIQSSDLKFKTDDDQKVSIKINYTNKEGKVESLEKGTNTGNVKTFTMSASDASEKQAEELYNLYNKKGFEGSFTTWLIPRVEPEESVMLNSYYLEGQDKVKYYVTATEVNFSSSGGSRKITLGRQF